MLSSLTNADAVRKLTEVATELLASLDKDDEILTAWIAEAERRADAHARGNTTWMPIDQAMAKARAGLVR